MLGFAGDIRFERPGPQRLHGGRHPGVRNASGGLEALDLGGLLEHAQVGQHRGGGHHARLGQDVGDEDPVERRVEGVLLQSDGPFRYPEFRQYVAEPMEHLRLAAEGPNVAHRR
jgi:hypothetical protein